MTIALLLMGIGLCVVTIIVLWVKLTYSNVYMAGMKAALRERRLSSEER